MKGSIPVADEPWGEGGEGCGGSTLGGGGELGGGGRAEGGEGESTSILPVTYATFRIVSEAYTKVPLPKSLAHTLVPSLPLWSSRRPLVVERPESP
jgi:hypothetical protein